MLVADTSPFGAAVQKLLGTEDPGGLQPASCPWSCNLHNLLGGFFTLKTQAWLSLPLLKCSLHCREPLSSGPRACPGAESCFPGGRINFHFEAWVCLPLCIARIAPLAPGGWDGKKPALSCPCPTPSASSLPTPCQHLWIHTKPLGRAVKEFASPFHTSPG